MVQCPHCQSRIVIKSDGTCPHCQQTIDVSKCGPVLQENRNDPATNESEHTTVNSVSESHPNTRIVPEGARLCPICGAIMIAEYNRGIRIDECRDHGVWLDKGELQEIVAQAKGITRKALLAAAEKDIRRAKHDGITWGWLSLLWD